MENKKNKLKILPVIFAALTVISLFLPTLFKSKYDGEIELTYAYDIAIKSLFTGYGIGILNVLLPILATVFLFMKSEKSDYIAYGLFGADSIYNFLICQWICAMVKEGGGDELYIGFYLFLLSSIAVAISVIILIMANCKKSGKRSDKKKKDDEFMDKLKKLEAFRMDGLLSEEEYKKKREELFAEKGL